MDASFGRLRPGGRMAVCGLIANYNDESPMAGPTGFDRVLMNRLTIRGFITGDYMKNARSAREDLAEWVRLGLIRWRDHVVEGLEAAPTALQMLFSGSNDGKLIVQVSPEPAR